MTTALIESSLNVLEGAVIELTTAVSPPAMVPFNDGVVYRYKEQLPQQAIVQKLARLVSVLRGARVLLDAGLLQEQATLQRIADDIQEDVVFLSLALLNNDVTPLHTEYLHNFYMEEHDSATGAPLRNEKPMTPRKKIRAYNARSMQSSSDPSGHITAARDIFRMYSGFVHASSPHIMDMCFGVPPVFHMRTMLGTVREADHRRDYYNYLYRGVSAASFGAHALARTDVGHALHKQSADIELFMYGTSSAA